MAKVLIVYYSKVGSTAQMAELVADGVREEGVEVVVQKVEDADVRGLLAYDAIICGSPTYYGLMAAEMKAFFDKSIVIHGQLEGKVGGAFTSAANLAGGNETTIISILEAMLIHGMVVQGTAHRDHYGPVALGKPDDRAVGECHKLGRNVARLAVKLFG